MTRRDKLIAVGFVMALGVLFHYFYEPPTRVARVCTLPNQINCFDIMSDVPAPLKQAAAWWGIRGAYDDLRCQRGCSVVILYDTSGAKNCDGPCDLTQADPEKRPRLR